MRLLKNDRLIQALSLNPVDRTPLWMMRQAGRYLPEYRQMRAKAGSFMQLCQTPKLASEITLQPLRRFDLDAAILFSDILMIPHAMGCPVEFIEGEGPRFLKKINDATDVGKLAIPDPKTSLSFVLEAIDRVQSALQGAVPLIGFAGSPWTVACYMLEGHGSQHFHQAKTFLYRFPEAMHTLLQKLSEATALYLQAQIDAGVDVVMLFDTWGGILSTEDYLEYSLAYAKKTLEQLSVPQILFTKGGGLWLEAMSYTGVHALGLDWTIDLNVARMRVEGRCALQGNLDPAILLSSPQKIEQSVQTLLEQYGKHPGHIFNLGHGIMPEVPIEHVEALIQAVHRFSRDYLTSS